MNTAGYLRGTMGIPYLLDGISPIPAMIGLLAAGQLLTLVTQDFIVDAGSARTVSLRRILAGCWSTFKYPGVLLRGTLIGIVMGIIPGVGSAVANLISYAETKRAAKDSDTFGQGNPKGVIGAEAAVASGEGGSMATMLTLGIPGHGAVAVLLAAFMMHNVVAGPSLIRQHKPLVYAMILNNILESIVLLGVGLGFIYVASNVVRLRTRYIVPVVLILAIMGTYAMDGTIAGPVTLFVFTADRRRDDALPLSGGGGRRRLAARTHAGDAGDPVLRADRRFAVLYSAAGPGAIGILLVMALSLGISAWSKRRNRRTAGSRRRRRSAPFCWSRRSARGRRQWRGAFILSYPAGTVRTSQTIRQRGPMSKKLIIMARINEYMPRANNRNVPFTPDEIAQTAADCEAAGASIVHFHARQPDGAPSYDPQVYLEVVEKIRAQAATSWSIPRSARTRSRATRTAPRISWKWARIPDARADMAAIDVGSTNIDVYDRTQQKIPHYRSDLCEHHQEHHVSRRTDACGGRQAASDLLGDPVPAGSGGAARHGRNA